MSQGHLTRSSLNDYPMIDSLIFVVYYGYSSVGLSPALQHEYDLSAHRRNLFYGMGSLCLRTRPSTIQTRILEKIKHAIVVVTVTSLLIHSFIQSSKSSGKTQYSLVLALESVTTFSAIPIHDIQHVQKTYS
jgi:hypothetical protein